MGEAWTGTQETCLPAACSDASQLWDCDNTLGLSFHICRVWGEDQTTRRRDNARSQKAFQENGGSVLPQEKWGTLGILRIGDVRLMWKVLDGYEFSLYTRHYNPRLSDCYKKRVPPSNVPSPKSQRFQSPKGAHTLVQVEITWAALNMQMLGATLRDPDLGCDSGFGNGKSPPPCDFKVHTNLRTTAPEVKLFIPGVKIKGRKQQENSRGSRTFMC